MNSKEKCCASTWPPLRRSGRSKMPLRAIDTNFPAQPRPKLSTVKQAKLYIRAEGARGRPLQVQFSLHRRVGAAKAGCGTAQEAKAAAVTSQRRGSTKATACDAQPRTNNNLVTFSTEFIHNKKQTTPKRDPKIPSSVILGSTHLYLNRNKTGFVRWVMNERRQMGGDTQQKTERDQASVGKRAHSFG